MDETSKICKCKFLHLEKNVKTAFKNRVLSGNYEIRFLWPPLLFAFWKDNYLILPLFFCRLAYRVYYQLKYSVFVTLILYLQSVLVSSSVTRYLHSLVKPTWLGPTSRENVFNFAVSIVLLLTTPLLFLHIHSSVCPFTCFFIRYALLYCSRLSLGVQFHETFIWSSEKSQ